MTNESQISHLIFEGFTICEGNTYSTEKKKENEVESTQKFCVTVDTDKVYDE